MVFDLAFSFMCVTVVDIPFLSCFLTENIGWTEREKACQVCSEFRSLNVKASFSEKLISLL